MDAIDEVVERLRAADAEDGADAYDGGYRAGERWARERARLRRLDRSLRAWSGGQPVAAAVRGIAGHFGDRIAIGLCWVLDGGDPDGPEAGGYWIELLGDPAGGDRIDDPEYAAGFAEGALGVWDRVRDSIDAAG